MSGENHPHTQTLINELQGLVETIEKNPKINPWVIRKTLKTIIEKVERRTTETTEED